MAQVRFKEKNKKDCYKELDMGQKNGMWATFACIVNVGNMCVSG